MKVRPSDWVIYNKLEDIEKLMIVQQREINDRFDKLENLISRENVLVTPELEQEIKRAAALTRSIDQKVKDL